LLDLPGIIEGAKDGKGRGRQVIGVARTCTCILIVLDVMKPLTHRRKIEYELEGFGIRLNQTPPNIVIKRKEKGGLNVVKSLGLELTHMSDDKSKQFAMNTDFRMPTCTSDATRQLTSSSTLSKETEFTCPAFMF